MWCMSGLEKTGVGGVKKTFKIYLEKLWKKKKKLKY